MRFGITNHLGVAPMAIKVSRNQCRRSSGKLKEFIRLPSSNAPLPARSLTL
jgi:hypothetical protein